MHCIHHCTVGSVGGAVLGTIVYNRQQWGYGMTFSQVCLVNGCMPLLLAAPFLYR